MKILVTCPLGIGSLLASELKRLGEKPFGTFERGTWVETDLAGMYRINLHSRLANKVYLQIAAGEAKTFDELFEQVKKSSYGQWISNTNISIKVASRFSQLTSLRTIQSVAHKAVLESVKNFGKEESFTTDLLLILENNQLSLFLNTSGASLHQRGYRSQAGLAPLKENLAAAMVLLSGRKFRSPLRDPFC